MYVPATASAAVRQAIEEKWTIHPHAYDRMDEFGFTEDDVFGAVLNPTNVENQLRPEHGEHVENRWGRHCGVAVNTDEKLVITVMMRTRGKLRYQHTTRKDLAPRMGGARPLPSGTYVVGETETRMAESNGWTLPEARAHVAAGYSPEQVARLSGFDVKLLRSAEVR